VLRLTIFLVAISSISCASSGTSTAGGDVVARGGPLRPESMPAANVTVGRDAIVVWAVTELPGNSRMQAAHAAIDAITRAELLKHLEVRVASGMADVASDELQRIKLVTAEAVRGRLAGSVPIEHGWVKLRRPDRIVLKLVARMVVPKTVLEKAVTEEPTLADARTRVLGAIFEEQP
jgi:hypothetical protein